MTDKNTVAVQAQQQQGQHIIASQKIDPKGALAQVAAIQQIMAQVMKEGTHYGVIPGTNLPSLYKSGSETLLSAFKIAVEPEAEAIRDGDHITYRVNCVGRHMASGIVVGIGVGEASTAEEKYSWRSAVCQEEYDDTPETHRRKKWMKGKYDKQTGSVGPAVSVLQVRTNPADLANTCLKMAKKRAQIDLTLTCLAASDCFTQDIEDLPPEYLEGMSAEEIKAAQTAKNNKYQAKPKSGNGGSYGGQGGGSSGPTGPASEAQIKLLRGRLQAANRPESDLCLHFSIADLTALDKSKVNDALDWIKNAGQA